MAYFADGTSGNKHKYNCGNCANYDKERKGEGCLTPRLGRAWTTDGCPDHKPNGDVKPKNKALDYKKLFEAACKVLGDIECPVLVMRIKDWDCSKQGSCDKVKNKPNKCWEKYFKEEPHHDR